jgi:hypothetical protein
VHPTLGLLSQTRLLKLVLFFLLLPSVPPVMPLMLRHARECNILSTSGALLATSPTVAHMLAKSPSALLHLAVRADNTHTFTSLHGRAISTPLSCIRNDGYHRSGGIRSSCRGAIVFLIEISSRRSSSIRSSRVSNGAPDRAVVHQGPELKVLVAVRTWKWRVYQIGVSVPLACQ